MYTRLIPCAILLGLLAASPAWSQGTPDCPPDIFLPVHMTVPDPCPDRPLHLVATACGPCVDLLGATHEPPGPIQIHASMDLRFACLLRACQPESLVVPIGVFAPGHHQIVVEVRGQVTRPDSSICTVSRWDTVRFDVPRDCPPVPPGPLPHVDVIRIGPPPPCPTCPPPPICPGVEIPFFIAGHFPDDCYEFRGLQLLYLDMGPLPRPPIARVLVAVNDCLGRPCTLQPVRWQAHALLQALRPGQYPMVIEVAEVSWCDTTNTPIALYSTIVPFKVAEECSIPPPPVDRCYLSGWRHDPAGSICDALLTENSSARLVFQIMSWEALAGLQGNLTLVPPDLRITGIEPIGPASGMHLAWQPEETGARFVLFAVHGAPIPACVDTAGAFRCAPLPVLAVTVEPKPGVPIPRVTDLYANRLLASDSLGREVPHCPTFTQNFARICAGFRCDFNGDGVTDVRDLVLMVRCVNGSGPCPADALTRFDCNRDGHLTLDDVLCCARVILHGGTRDTTLGRPVPDLRVVLGTPQPMPGRLDVPVRLHRADLVGAARLAFGFTGGFEAGTVELMGETSSWLHLDEAVGSELVLGLIGLDPTGGSEALDFVLRFELPAGQSPAGEVRLTGADFSGHDGVRLIPGSGPTSVTIAPPRRLELAPAQPNPFARETRLRLSVTAASELELGVYDLSGRLVTTLHRGRLEAGTHTFFWSGTRSDGTRVPDGVYFYRARGAGVLAARKMVLLRGE